MVRSGAVRHVAAAALLLGAALAALAAPAAAQADPDTGFRAEGELPWNVRGTTIQGLRNQAEVEMANQMLRGFLSIAKEVNTGVEDPVVVAAAAPDVRAPGGEGVAAASAVARP